MQSFGLPLAKLGEELLPGRGLLVTATLDSALEHVEHNLLRRIQQPGQCPGFDYRRSVQELACVDKPSAPLFGVWLEIHLWMQGFYPSYSPKLLLHLQNLVEVRKLQPSEIIYEAPARRPNSGAWLYEASAEEVPPLVWLLQGCVEHVWNPSNEKEQAVRSFELKHDLQPGQLWEKACIRDNLEFGCTCPFGTVRAFLSCTRHPGTLLATEESTVALLPQRAYDLLPAETRKLLNAYLLRQWPLYLNS